MSSKRVKKLRKSLGLSQEGLARLIGVSFQTVNRWENGVSEPSDITSLIINSLEKVVASGEAGKIMEEVKSGRLAGGSGPLFQRIFSVAFGLPAEKTELLKV